MSRIDEALKRLADDSPNRTTSGSGTVPFRPVEVVTLDHYPAEKRPHAERVAAPAAEATPAVQPRVTQSRVPTPAAAPAPTAPAITVRLAGELAGKLVVDAAAAPVMVEQYRRLAAALHDAQVERGLKTLMVTSALPREGKTLTAINLALTLSESYGRRVLLIDADLRRPSAHEVIGVPNDTGLSEALASAAGVPALARVSAGFSVLPAGHPGPSPLAGLTSDRMRELLDEFEAQFDWVILDTPPVGLLPDGQLMARLTRAVVFVIGAGSSQYPAVERAIADLGRDCIIGTVLNRVDERVIPDKAYYADYQATS